MASEMAITSMLDLTSFKAMGAAKSRRVTVNPETNASFSSSASTTDVYFSLPSGKFSFINGQNSYIVMDVRAKYTASTTAAAAVGFCNGSASSLIRSMEVQLQSQSVELLDKYNVFAALVEDFQPIGRSGTVMNITAGGPNAADGSVANTVKQSIQLGTVSAFSATGSVTAAAVSAAGLFRRVVSALGAALLSTTGAGLAAACFAARSVMYRFDAASNCAMSCAEVSAVNFAVSDLAIRA